MDTTIVTLKSAFIESKSDLIQKLNGLHFPSDAMKIQKLTTEHLNLLFENENNYRQSLTESEDLILLSVLRLLQSQQNITDEIAKTIENNCKNLNIEKEKHSKNPYWTVAGAGAGAVVGGLINSWGAVAGAIVGTALVIYFSIKPTIKSGSQVESENFSSTITNTNVFISIIENICENIDNIIETYRVQIRRVENIYNQREEPSLQNEYSILLSQIVNVYNTAKTLNVPIPDKLSAAIDFLAESLENYGLKIENGKIINA